MLTWTAIQNIITDNGKIPMSVEVTFGMQTITKLGATEQLSLLSVFNTLYDYSKVNNSPINCVGNSSNNVLLPIIVRLQNKADYSGLWYRLLVEQFHMQFENLDEYTLRMSYIACLVCPDERDLLYDTYIALGSNAYMTRVVKLKDLFNYEKYLSEDNPLIKVKLSMPGILRDTVRHEELSMDDPFVEADKKVIMLYKEYPNQDVADHVYFFYTHNDIRYLKMHLDLKPVNPKATQILVTTEKGERELYLVTSNHHQVMLSKVTPAIAWCVAYAPEAFKDKPIRDVLDYMMPLYDKKFNKRS